MRKIENITLTNMLPIGTNKTATALDISKAYTYNAARDGQGRIKEST